jgi:peptide/nickel transport system ATP-binding protein
MAIMYLGRFVEWGDTEPIYDDPQHPYTDALLDAVPLPDPTRRGRDKRLPRGEIPDALFPPSGCPFHPRCPRAFDACGWEGRDLVEAIEQRWTTVDEDTFEREAGLVGDLSTVEVSRHAARFSAADADGLRDWLAEIGPQLPTAVFSAVQSVEAAGGGVEVELGPGPAPALQPVAGRMVACHLHGIVPRAGEEE